MNINLVLAFPECTEFANRLCEEEDRARAPAPNNEFCKKFLRVIILKILNLFAVHK
jgi:hypothetical protein